MRQSFTAITNRFKSSGSTTQIKKCGTFVGNFTPNVLTILVLLTTLSLACNFSFSTASIQEAELAKDQDGTEPTTVFDQDDEFYVVGTLANAPDDTMLKAVWTAVEADGVEPNYELDEKEFSGGDDYYFSLTNDQLWPTGSYKVDLYLNDELERTLEFTVEGEVVAEAPSPTPESSPTPEPSPTLESEPSPLPEETEEAELDSLSTDGDTLVIEATAEPEEEAEPLPLQEELYTHPSGAFSFAVPEGWELVNETDQLVVWSDERSLLGAEFNDAGAEYTVSEFNEVVDNYVASFVGEDIEYEVLEEDVQPDDSLYVAVSYTDSNDIPSDVDFFFEQRDNVMFVFFFDSFDYLAMRPTWDEIIPTYSVDPEAAKAAAPAPAPAPAEPLPTATPPPAPAMPAGKGMLSYCNYSSVDFVIDIIGPTPVSGTTIGPNSCHDFTLDPGNYQYNGHAPGGQFTINTTDFVVVAGQVTQKGVQ